MRDNEKPFLDHLEDLRGVILKCAAAIGAGSLLGVMGIGQVMEILRWPLTRAQAGVVQPAPTTLLALQVTDPMTVTLQIGIGAGILVSLPFVLFFIGQYLLPALESRERGLLLPAFLVGAFLFLLGASFCYFVVLPQALRFFRISIIGWGWRPVGRWLAIQILSFRCWWGLDFPLSFRS